ncbi:hypothetical protein L218DRAFT_259408 [Marasmius fiardii PR-910]|nr:hypothetical protein L218DRAFT_259408 [Marasmius fiardii PR-910]
MPSIRNGLELPCRRQIHGSHSVPPATVNTLLSSSTPISLQPPISTSEVVLIVIAAFFTLVVAAVTLHVYLFRSPQVTVKATRSCNIFRKSPQSAIREKPSVEPVSPRIGLLEVPGGPCHNLEPDSAPRSETLVLSSSNTNSNDECTALSIRAGLASVWRRTQRSRTGSQSSATTTTTTTTATMSDSLCTTSIPRSSVTSLTSEFEHTDSEIDLDGMVSMEEEGGIYEVEVKRAQTQSMEVKRGILVSWRFSEQPKELLPPPPMVVISESEESTDAIKASPFRKDARSISNGFLCPQSTPSLCSLASSESSASSVSVDLDEFPLPPKLLTTPSTSLSSSFLTVPKHNPIILQKDDIREGKRSTVDHVIMLYA